MALQKPRVDTKNATVVKRSNYADTLDAIVKEGFCPFCEQNLFKHHPKSLLYSSKYWLVTENAWPYEGARFHFLLIARTHAEKTEDLPPAGWTDLHALYKKLVKRHELSGATLMIRSGNTKITGASVNHLHAHLVVGSPRTKRTKSIKALIGFRR